MRIHSSLGVAVVASAFVAVFGTGSALAKDGPPFGQRVAACAHESLGKRPNPPAIACVHDDMTMVFANFGEMVRHMKEHHG